MSTTHQKPAVSKSTIAAAVKTSGVASTCEWLISEGHALDLEDASTMIEQSIQL